MSLPLERSQAVHDALDHFLEACCYWLDIEGDPHWQKRRFWTAPLQTFEGVPEVYPFAFRLLEAIGPGRGHEVGWVRIARTPGLISSVTDVARLVRGLIVEDWGWEPGWTDAQLRSLVAERQATGMPQLRSKLDEKTARIEASINSNLPPDRRWEVHAAPSTFREVIPEAKREQFERIVQLWLEEFKNFPMHTNLNLPDVFREITFRHVDYLDKHESEVQAFIAKGYDLSEDAHYQERYRYENEPLIGRRAATLTWKTFGEMREAQESLYLAMEAENSSKQATTLVEDSKATTPDASPPPMKQISNPPESLADQVRKRHPRAGIAIEFLTYMEEIANASFVDLAEKVHGDSQTSDGAIRRLVCRVNNYLEELACPLRFRVGSSHVIKQKHPE